MGPGFWEVVLVGYCKVKWFTQICKLHGQLRQFLVKLLECNFVKPNRHENKCNAIRWWDRSEGEFDVDSGKSLQYYLLITADSSSKRNAL